jgi:hypothetical protein
VSWMFCAGLLSMVPISNALRLTVCTKSYHLWRMEAPLHQLHGNVT